MGDRVGKEFLVTDQLLLFPRKWDRSRWDLRFEINWTLDTVQGDVFGWGGVNGEYIARQGVYHLPCANWADVFEYTSTTLRSHLQRQMESPLSDTGWQY